MEGVGDKVGNGSAGLAYGGVKCGAVVDGGDIISAYHNMSLRDRKLAADIIDTDVTYRMVKNILQDLDILPEPGEEE